MTAELEPLADLLARHELAGVPEERFPNDGWSGAVLTQLRRRDGRGFVMKRNRFDRDWIAQATNDDDANGLREALFAAYGPPLPWPAHAAALGAGRDTATGEQAILMPDLTGVLFDWNAAITVDELDRVLGGMAALHSTPAEEIHTRAHDTPWDERLRLICRTSLEGPGPAHDAVGTRILPGWDAWDRTASGPAKAVIAALSGDSRPLLDALSAEPSALLHGDLKLANVGIGPDGAIEMVDWQMVMVAPVAVELGWFLVSNVNALPLPPDEVLDRYWRGRGLDGSRQNDVAILVGLLLRGWRKGYDAEAGITLASGVSAADDLAWWCDRAVAAADRLF